MSTNDPVVELRVHGVSGTPPEAMLDDPFPIQVAGDDVARFLRRRPTQSDAPTSHVLEAFHWGRFTSGSPTRALWLLLAPFAILNLAGFTLLPAPDGRDPSRMARLVIRLLGVLLTAALLVAVAHAMMNLVMHQCAGAAVCRDTNSWLSAFDGPGDGLRFLAGVLPPAAVIGLLWWFGRQTFLYDPPGRPAGGPPSDEFSDRGFWHTGALVIPLRAAHVTIACGVLGILCVRYHELERTGAVLLPGCLQTGLHIAFGVLITVAVVVVARPSRFVDPASGKLRSCRALRGFSVPAVAQRSAVVLLGIAVIIGTFMTWSAKLKTAPLPEGSVVPGRRPLPGFEAAATTIMAALVLLLVALAAACWYLRHRYAPPHDLPRAFRPLWSGFAPLVLTSLAVLLGGGFSSGLAFWVANLLGRTVPASASLAPVVVNDLDRRFEWGIEVGASYMFTGLLSGCAVVAVGLALPGLLSLVLRTRSRTSALLVTAAVVGLVTVWNRILGLSTAAVAVAAGAAVALAFAGALSWRYDWAYDGLRDLVSSDYAPEPVPAGQEPNGLSPTSSSDMLDKIALRWRLARSKYRFHWVIGFVAALGGSAVTVAAALTVFHIGQPLDRDGWAVGPFVLSAVAAGFLTLGLRSWKSQKLRIAVGVLWDLLAFWPRAAHPLCPPPYGGRAVLELARRANDLAQISANKAVVLSGHSQGSLVCVAAVAVLHAESLEPDQRTPVFIRQAQAKRTLSKVSLITYGSQLQWAYARLFPRYAGHEFVDETFRTRVHGRWRNLHRWTDPLGGPVLAWQPDGRPAPLRGADSTQTLIPIAPFALTVMAGAGVADYVGPDIRLRDPVRVMTGPDHVRSPLRAHSGYPADPAYTVIVEELLTQQAPAQPDA